MGWRLRFGVAGRVVVMIGVKRIYLPLFHLTCTLGTISGRNPGRCTVLLLAMGINKEEGDV